MAETAEMKELSKNNIPGSIEELARPDKHYCCAGPHGDSQLRNSLPFSLV